MKSEIIAAIITVGGSVLTFALASWFSLISRNADDKRYLCHQLLDHRFKFYEELLFWLPVEQLTKVISTKDFNLSSYRTVFMEHFGEFSKFIARARLYASDEVTAELVAFQESYNGILSEILRNKISDQIFIDLIERGKDPFSPLLELHKTFADRIILIVSEEMTLDAIQKSFGKSKKKRYKKTACNKHDKNCN